MVCGKFQTIGPAAPALSFDQIRQLWVANGGSQLAAPIMAAIAVAESGGVPNRLNDCPSSGDYSVGLFQINYYGGLANGRTANYGAPGALAADVASQVRAAVAISGNGTNLRPWSTWTNGAAQTVLAAHGGAAMNAAAAPALPSSATAAGPVDGEGSWTMPGPIPNVSRRLVRKVLGGAVMVTGGAVGLAGVFVLVGGSLSRPKPLQALSGLQGARREGRLEEARVTMAARGRRRDEDDRATERQARTTPDEVAARRRARAEARRIREGQASASDIPSTGEPF